MDLAIRELAQPDLDGLLALYSELHPSDDPLPERPIVEALWRSIVEDPAQIYVGGFSGGAVVSACNAAIVPNLTRGARPYAVIENVVTAARHRRRGFGSTVMRALLERCRERNCYKIMLLSGAARADAYGFYDSLGFDRRAKQAFVITLR